MLSSHRRRTLTIAAAGTVLLMALLLVATAHADNWLSASDKGDDGFGAKKNLTFLVGARLLDSADWKPVDKQPLIGVDFDYTPAEWPVSLCSSLLYSRAKGTADDVDVSLRSWELQLGLRKIWAPILRLRPYVGAGGSLLRASFGVDGLAARSGSDATDGYGFWVGAGAYLRLGSSWQVGGDARWSRVNVDVGDTRANAGGLQVGVTAGYHWSDW